MAPEMLTEQPRYSALADVYSLALVLFELWTSKRPYPQKYALSLSSMHAAVVTRGERPVDSNGVVPQEVMSLLQWCWAGEARQRPAVAQVADWLRSFIVVTQKNEGLHPPVANSKPYMVCYAVCCFLTRAFSLLFLG